MSNTAIMGSAVATAEQMANYVLSVNPNPKLEIPILTLAKLFLLAGEIEGVRGDLEFARSCHETGNFAFKGTMTPDQKNFCGHGTVSATVKGSYFPDEFYSALVQCQHAKAYATAEPLNYTCLDDRYKWVTLGSAPNMEDMGGKWAVPGYEPAKYASLEEAKKANDSYGDKIVKIMNKILAMPKDIVEEPKQNTSVEEPKQEVAAKPLAGKKLLLDPGHAGHYNRSPGVPEYYESVIMWEYTLKQKKHLEALGAIVDLSRSNLNDDVALVTRGKRSAGYDAFISNHTDAVGSYMNEKICYASIYHLSNDATTNIDDLSKHIASVLAPALDNAMPTVDGCRILTRNSSNDRNSDGILNDNYYGVLHGARLVGTPGIIVEHGFHTNTATVKWLLDDNNLDKLAKAEAEAIAVALSNSSVATSVYEVRSGDTLSSIGRMFGIDWKEIAILNNIPGPYVIKPGQTLRLPVSNETNPYPVPTYTLYRGREDMAKEHVRWLQWELNQLGANLEIDGSFGPATESALRETQKNVSLIVDGRCGPATRAALLNN